MASEPLEQTAIVYLSASGNTARVAGWIKDELLGRDFKVEEFTIPDVRESLPAEIIDADILFVGTPTYMWHTPQIVSDFLSSLPQLDNKPVGLFTTFGGVTVGSNLSRMTRRVNEKKGRVVGLLQLTGQHTMMFKSDAPLAKGKPDEDDIPYVRRFVGRCLERAAGDEAVGAVPGIMKNFSWLSPVPIARRVLPQLKLDKSKCTLCGECVANCPMGNITIADETVHHGDDCLLCYNCVRVCPTGAVDANLQSIENPLRLISHLPEKPTAVY